MSEFKTNKMMSELTQSDLIFLVETVDPKLLPKLELIQSDPWIVERMLENESGKLFQRVMFKEQGNLASVISPRFLFEILLRRAFVELQTQSFTVERTAGQKVPVFDSDRVVKLLSNRSIMKYLADMLSSFTKVESFTIPVRVRKGIWRRIRFSDMDIESLIKLCELSDKERRFGFYKKIGDLSLFILGMFPEYTIRDSFGMTSRHARAWQRSQGYYENTGRLFYRLASEHHDAKILDLTDVFIELHEHFDLAIKPLSYISEHFIQFRKQSLFPFSS